MKKRTNRFVTELTECFGGDVYFDNIGRKLLEQHDHYLTEQGNNENTRHKKFKVLAKYFDDAKGERRADAENPFRQYKIPTVPVKKEKVTFEQLKSIENLKLAPGSVNDARNLFLLSYYCKGMRFENCATLMNDQISNGRINFRAMPLAQWC